jgi:hypothetical protein
MFECDLSGLVCGSCCKINPAPISIAIRIRIQDVLEAALVMEKGFYDIHVHDTDTYRPYRSFDGRTSLQSTSQLHARVNRTAETTLHFRICLKAKRVLLLQE